MFSNNLPKISAQTVEFFILFFDITGQHILEIVEESRTMGVILGAINSTFLALIPKLSNPSISGDFRPILVCNILYKTVSS